MLGRTLQLGVCLLLLLGCREAPADSTLSVTDLARVLRGVRLVEPRFSGGFDYAPCVPVEEKGRLIPRVQCSPFPEEGSWKEKQLNDLQSRLRAQSEGFRSPKVSHAKAVFNAIFGATRRTLEAQERFLERAINGLEHIRVSFPLNALLLNDLAATYFLQAVVNDDPSILAKALDLIEQAHSLSPTVPEIRFNRALMLDRWKLRYRAQSTWEIISRQDKESGWASVANRAIAVLDDSGGSKAWVARIPSLELAALKEDGDEVRAIVGSDAMKAWHFIVESLLGEWGECYLEENFEGAGRALKIAENLATFTEHSRLGPSASSSIATIKAAVSSSADRTRKLARGHKLFRDSQVAFAGMATDQAQFHQARTELKDAGSLIWLWALLGEGRIESYSGNYRKAERIFRRVLASDQAEISPDLRVSANWGLGWIAGRYRDLSSEYYSYSRALAACKLIGDLEVEGFLLHLLAENRESLGLTRDAWRLRFKAQARLAIFPLSPRRHTALVDSGSALNAQGLSSAALVFQDDNLEAAKRRSHPTWLAEASWSKARTLGKLREFTRALESLENARTYAHEAPAGAPREILLADLKRSEAEILSEVDPFRAVRSADEAVEMFENRRVPGSAASARLTRAQILMKLSRPTEAKLDFLWSLALFETLSSGVDIERQRLAYLESIQPAYDGLIELHWKQQEWLSALSVLERGRQLTAPLQRQLQAIKTNAGIRTACRMNLRGRVVLVYATLRDRLLVWMLSSRGVEHWEKRIGSLMLGNRINRLLTRIQSGWVADSLDEDLEELYLFLVPPSLSSVPSTEVLFIVPDRVLSKLPFSALRNPSSGEFLMQEHPISILPSFRDALLLPRIATRRGAPSTALIVGNPAFDRRVFHSLRDLPGSQREVDLAASAFARNVLLSGRTATSKRILSELARHDLFIFAGHAGAQAGDPSQAFLVTASENGTGGGLLFGSDLSRSHLDELDVVVLSACASIGPRDTRASGFSGIGRAFLEAGVPGVLASLWDVRDVDTSTILGEFYRNLAGGNSPIESLMMAQSTFIRTRSSRRASLRAWAGFEFFGQ